MVIFDTEGILTVAQGKYIPVAQGDVILFKFSVKFSLDFSLYYEGSMSNDIQHCDYLVYAFCFL